jgi:hypothetical protein
VVYHADPALDPSDNANFSARLSVTLPRTSQTLAIPGLSFGFVCPNMIRVLIAKAKYEGQQPLYVTAR